MNLSRLIGVFMILLLASPVLAAREDCDCNIYPYQPDPPCFDVCSVQLLAEISVEEAQEVLGLSSDLAERAVFAFQQEPYGLASSIYDYELKDEELALIERRLRGLSQEQFKILRNNE